MIMMGVVMMMVGVLLMMMMVLVVGGLVQVSSRLSGDGGGIQQARVQ